MSLKSRITVGMVSYKSLPGELVGLLTALAASEMVSEWVLVDNAAAEDPVGGRSLQAEVERHGGRYVASPRNGGFGAGHNLALDELSTVAAEYHLMVNPDITFEPHVLSALVGVMDARPQVGWVMPKVLYPDGSVQRLCKLIPSPLHFAVRRFLPTRLHGWIRSYLDHYELCGLEDTPVACPPFLSGCFVMTRRALLQRVGGFDERYFLYMEDVDLCRRMAEECELLYWPEVAVTHGYHRGSHRTLRLMLAHVRSSITYFNRWGWIFDRRRARVNGAALRLLRETNRGADAASRATGRVPTR